MARVCDLETGRCPEPNRCDIDDECDPDRVCITHLCHDPCVAGGCPGNQACENFRCEEPAQCADDVDCIGVRICSRNRCDAPCQENADCLGADVCDVPSGHCVELHPECAIEEDCPADHACILGACRQGVCQVHLNCAENEDCIDGACAPALRPNCRDRDDCPAGQTCASFGACVAANPCQNDGQCLGARNVCWLGRCAACRVDSDCTASEACDQGRCVSHGFCAADADCPGDTTACANARCTPAPCEGDNLDFQLGTPRVMARTYSDLVLCDGDMDHYSVEVGPGQGLNVSLHHDPGAGDLELVLRSLGEEARGESQNGIARAGILSAGPPRMIDVIITGRAGYRTPYRLDVRPTIEDGCVPDNDEPPLGNDLQGSAMPVGDGSAQVVTRLCEGDLDWLSFIVPGGTTARATLSTDNLAAVEMNLYSDRGALIAEAINDGRNKIVSAEADFRTTFGLKLDLAVGGGSASNTVSFEVEAGANAAAAACMDAGWAAVGEPYWFRPQLSADRFIGACNAPGEFYDRVLRFRVEAAGQYQIDTLGTDRNATIIIRSECPGADAELHCVQGGSLGPVALALGEYYLILDSAASGPQGVLIHPVQ